MPSLRDDSRNGERLVALFLLGIVLFNPLVVDIFDVGADSRPFGIPTLYLYLFVAWGLLIGLIAMVAENAPKTPTPPPGPTGPVHEND
jgi:hypothetical protein